MKMIGEKIRSFDKETPDVELIDWDEEAEIKIAAASLYPYTNMSEKSLLELVRKMDYEEIENILPLSLTTEDAFHFHIGQVVGS